MQGTTIEIPTTGGKARAYVTHPEGAGPWPAVLFLMDGLGWRQALFDMADRLASHGYVVLVPDLFWRSAPFEPFDPKVAFAGGPETQRLMAIIGAVTPEGAMDDVRTFLDHLAARPDVRDPGRLALTGYCLGGGLAVLAACTFPDRIAAAASFHGGRFLCSPEAPGEIAKKVKARIYVGVAEVDRSHTPEVTERLTGALTSAGVPFAIELYEGTAHGWAVNDMPVYHREGAERHWDRLLALLRETFG